MANVKKGRLRELILDRYLKTGRGYTVMQLKEIVNRGLDLEGYTPVTSHVTIYSDINTIAGFWKQPIRRRQEGRTVFYSYRDPDFSIYDGQLTDGELNALYKILSAIKNLKNFKYKEEVEHILENISVILFRTPSLY